MKITMEKVQEIYGLCRRMYECWEEGLCNFSVDDDKSKEAYKKGEEIERTIEATFRELGKTEGLADALFAEKLLKAVYPKSISRYIQCLQVCGVEVVL